MELLYTNRAIKADKFAENCKPLLRSFVKLNHKIKLNFFLKTKFKSQTL